MPSHQHILVIRLSAMGDVAMTVPVLQALVQQYPKVKITIVTKPQFKPFFKTITNVSVNEVDTRGTHKGIFGLWKLSRSLKKLRIDAVADLHNVLRSNFLKLFLSITPTVQIDKGRQAKKDLVNGRVFEQLKTTHQRYVDVFEQLGFPLELNASHTLPKATLSSEHLDVIGRDSKPWIGIAPFAAFDGKTYPIDLMTEVIKELSKTYKILLFGAKGNESETLQEIADEFDNVINLAGIFSFENELDIIANLDLMISMDSGNAHIAAMYGVQVITIWGVTHPFAGFMPFNHDTDSAVMADKSQFPKIPTSIYGNKLPEGYNLAMRSITPKAIISKVSHFLK
ncbi:glycosyltransferase family 9 protein [Psychroserpens sp. BH13MA-6]